MPWAPTTVTALCSDEKPRSTCSGSQTLSSSFSAMHDMYLAGLPCTDMSVDHGLAPPTFRSNSRTALPMVALARLPGPKVPRPLLRPICSRTGPLMIRSGATGLVVVCKPWMLNAGSMIAWTAATKTGIYSGRQPAITAFTAIFSKVADPASGLM